METETTQNAPELARALATARSETLVAANNARFHANVVFDQDLAWHSSAANQKLVVGALEQGGFSAEYRSSCVLRVEWGHAVLQQSVWSVASLQQQQQQQQLLLRPSLSVEEALHSALCRRARRSGPPRRSRFFDPALTRLSPQDVLERAAAHAQASAAVVSSSSSSSSAQAVQRAVAKLTQGEVAASLSRLSSAAQHIEAETSLAALETEIEVQRNKDDSLHAIDTLFGEINSSAKAKSEDPLEALELELKKGPTHRQLREVEAMIDEVDMAATPNTRRKNQMARKAARDQQQQQQQQQQPAVAADALGPARLELTQEALSRTSKAKVLADETFEKEARRLAKLEEEKLASQAARLEQEQQALIRAAEEAERAVEADSRSFVPSVASTTFADTSADHATSEDQRLLRAQAEARDKALKEAALAEEQRNLRELKAAQMEALARQRELEEREAAEERAALELQERARQAAEQEALEKERAIVAAQLQAQEARLAELQAQAEREAEAKVKAAQAEAERRRHELEALQKQAAVGAAPIVTVPDDVAFTPIAASKGGLGNNLETPLTLAVKDEMNLDAMLGELNFDIEIPRDNASFSAPVNKHLGAASSTPANLSRTSAAVRDLGDLDNLMAGMDGFSFDATAIAASEPAKSVAATSANSSLNDSRTGGLKLSEPVKTEDLDVEAALGSMDFSSVASKVAPHQDRGLHHDFSVVVPHNTAAEVAAATHTETKQTVSTAAPIAVNAFDDFKIDTIDTSGTSISSSLLNVDVNMAAIGATSPAKTEPEAKSTPATVASAPAPAPAKTEAPKVEEAPAKKAEVIQDEKSKAGFGDKKAMFESQQQPAAAPAKPGKNAKKNKKKNKNKK